MSINEKLALKVQENLAWIVALVEEKMADPDMATKLASIHLAAKDANLHMLALHDAIREQDTRIAQVQALQDQMQEMLNKK